MSHALRQELIDSGEEWSDAWENVLEFHPQYLASYLRLRKVPINDQYLPRKVQELVLLAMDASCTHLFEPGIRAHTAAALHAGAKVEEIMETLELTSVLGGDTLSVGVPLLMEVMEEGMGGGGFPREFTDREERLKANFERHRGYWNPTWHFILRNSPRFMDAYTDYTSLPYRDNNNTLEPKVKYLIYIAIDCSTTHLYKPGLKHHIREALDCGASQDEVLEVFELATLMGVQTVLIGAHALKDELVKANTRQQLFRRLTGDSVRSEPERSGYYSDR